MLAMLSAPAIKHYIQRSRHEGIARSTAALLLRGRMEAIRMSRPVVVRLDYDNDEVIAFADVNDAGGDPVSDLLYNPVDDLPDGGKDYELGRVQVPEGRLWFWGAGDVAAEGPEAVVGFTAVAGETPNVAILDPDGTVRDRGAFRFGDDRGNVIEVLVSPEATARIQIRKYDPDREDSLDGTGYFPPGSGDQRWVWFD